MKHIMLFCFTISIILLILSGCSVSGGNASESIVLTEDDICTEFHLHLEGWNEYERYDIVPSGEGWRLTYAVWQGQPNDRGIIADCIVTDSTAKEVSAVLAKYNAGRWSSYYQYDKNVYDANGFTLDVTYPEFSITAEGYPDENIPKELHDMAKEIKTIFAQYNGRIEF